MASKPDAQECLTKALAGLPHGNEFRFVTRLSALTPGESAAGEYFVRGDEPFLAGHFPGDPLFPGVLLVEAAAQLAGIVAQSGSVNPSTRLRLTALRAVKILGTARPGETIYMQARLLHRLGSLIQAQASAAVEGRTILQAELTLSEEVSPPQVPREAPES